MMPNLKIHDRRPNGKGCKYPDKPLVFVRKSVTVLTTNAQQKVGFKKDDRVIFANDDDIYYVAVPPIDATVFGRKISMVEGNGIGVVGAIDKRGGKIGIYSLKDPVFIDGIDWFEMELIRETENN